MVGWMERDRSWLRDLRNRTSLSIASYTPYTYYAYIFSLTSISIYRNALLEDEALGPPASCHVGRSSYMELARL